MQQTWMASPRPWTKFTASVRDEVQRAPRLGGEALAFARKGQASAVLFHQSRADGIFQVLDMARYDGMGNRQQVGRGA